MSEIRSLRDAIGPARPNLVPVCREVVADLETPVSAYLKVTGGGRKGSFLLESVEGGERIARYSFIGTEPRATLSLGGGVASLRDAADNLLARRPFQDPLETLRAELGGFRPARLPGLPRFQGGAVGYLSYDAVHHFERLPRPSRDSLALPEGVFLFTDTLLIFDHLQHRIKILTLVPLDGDLEAEHSRAVARIDELVGRLEGALPRRSRLVGAAPIPNPPPPFPCRDGGGVLDSPPRRGEGLGERPLPPSPALTSNFTQPSFEAAVRRAKEYIAAGDVIQVVLSQRLSRPTLADPFDVYRALRALNPSPYMYYLDLPDCTLVGASPELLVRVEDGLVTTHPIAGTRRRGRDAAEDERLEAELRGDEKEQAEHIMLVDLGRNDLGRVSQPGTVFVPQLMGVERYSHVMHLVSHVTGRLRAECTPFDALRACFPAGTVSGAPKVRAMEIIAELEPDQRGPYAGAVGYFDYGGTLDTCITIRTIVMKDGIAHIQAGAGIVADSVPELEYRETLSKAQALLRAIDAAEAHTSPLDNHSGVGGALVSSDHQLLAKTQV